MATKRINSKSNTIYRGDNLQIMRLMPDESVDLVYIDPPFFTQRDYKNIWGDKESVVDYEEKIAFKDTRDFFEKHVDNGAKGLHAYLTWLRMRLLEIHRLLKPSGSLYCHLDYHAVHYVKVMLDEIFGYDNFRNEIIWQRKQGSNSTTEPKQFSNNTDTILFYSRTKDYLFIPQYQSYSEEYIRSHYSHEDERGYYTLSDMRSPSYRPNLVYDYKGYKPHKNGWCVTIEMMKELDKKGLLHFPANKSGRIRKKNYLEDRKGIPLTNIWSDIGCLQGQSKEKTGWPTQKPLALLERIISASCPEGGIVLDCFAGCGTSMHAAHNLKRKWIGIDVSPTAIKVNQKRLQDLGAKVTVVDESELIKVGRAG